MTKLVSIILAALLLTACVTQAERPSEVTPGQARLATAEAMFQERCKTAGEKIYRTAENVEGVFLMKLRPAEINYADQFKLDDPYGNDSSGDTYVKTFFSGFYRNSSPPPPKGYN